jgi:hypothetical protein
MTHFEILALLAIVNMMIAYVVGREDGAKFGGLFKKKKEKAIDLKKKFRKFINKNSNHHVNRTRY